MIKTIFIFIFIISISSCGGIKDVQKENVSQKKQTNTHFIKSDFVILPFKQNWNWLFTNAKPTKLTNNELFEIEKILNIAIIENNEQQKKILEEHNSKFPNEIWQETGYEISVDKKKRQYVAVINEYGEKEIWINFFCGEQRDTKWKQFPLEVNDGGNCYFYLKVNLTKNSYSDLYINGYA